MTDQIDMIFDFCFCYSKCIVNQLQPHAREHKLCVKDSSDFIQKINNMGNIPPDNSFLVTMDAPSLYINIPNKEGI